MKFRCCSIWPKTSSVQFLCVVNGSKIHDLIYFIVAGNLKSLEGTDWRRPLSFHTPNIFLSINSEGAFLGSLFISREKKKEISEHEFKPSSISARAMLCFCNYASPSVKQCRDVLKKSNRSASSWSRDDGLFASGDFHGHRTWATRPRRTTCADDVRGVMHSSQWRACGWFIFLDKFAADPLINLLLRQQRCQSTELKKSMKVTVL